MLIADLLTAMEGAVLPDGEDLSNSATEQPESSQGGAQSHGEALRQTTGLALSTQHLHFPGTSERVPEQPESSRGAAQIHSVAAQRMTALAAPAHQPTLGCTAQREDEMHGSMQAQQSLAAFSTLLPAPVASPDLLVRPFQDLLPTPERAARMVRNPGIPYELHMQKVDPSHVWVDGLGVVERVKNPHQRGGGFSQRLAAAAP